MSWRRFIFRRWWDDERRRELQSYIDIETDDNLARGMSPADARRAAHRKLGNPTLIREDIYRMNTLRVVETIWQDVRYGARLLRLNPGFALVALSSLALGVGANTAVFQLLDAVRLRPLPVERPEELVEVRPADRSRSSGAFNGRRPMLTNAVWEQLRDRQEVFTGLAAWTGAGFDLSAGGESRPVEGLYVSGGFFSTLGVRAAAGRLLGPSDDVRDCAAPAAVISHGFWQREYGGDPAVIGRTIRIDGRTIDLVGITEARFFGVDVGRSFDVALPLCAEPLMRGAFSSLQRPQGWFLAALGRLKPGVSREQATAHLNAISPAIFQATVPPQFGPADVQRYLEFRLAAFTAATGVSSVRRIYETPLWVLLGTTALILLIACANLANLMLARATAREREIAVRLAMGASRLRLIGQLMSESLLLAALGAFLGLLAAQWMSGFLVAFLNTTNDRIFVQLAADWRVFGFAGALAVVTCVIFGLAPALRATHAAPVAAMRSGSRTVTDSRERFGLRRALVVVQVALSLVLMIGALLFVRSLANLQGTDLGFDPGGVIIAGLDLRRAPVPAEQRITAFRDATAKLITQPGINGAAQVDIVPVSGSGWNGEVITDLKMKDTLSDLNRISPGYFAVMRTPFVAGRDFTDADAIGAPNVAIVNEHFARTFFPGASPLGRTFQIDQPPGAPRPHYLIVGVVRDTKYRDVREETGSIAYFPAAQDPEPQPYVQWAIRTDGTARAMDTVKRLAAEWNPAIAIQFTPMDEQIAEALLPERLMATLSGFFGGLAVLISMVGLYGVMSYVVTRRRNEIGIRMALGADGATVIRMVLRESAVLVVIGIAAGIGLSIYAARFVSTLLFGLQPQDPLTIVLSVLALAAVATTATVVPARRAARVDPTVALRQD